jgi:predicted ester cyclase
MIRMATADNIAAIRAQNDAMNRGDIDGALAYWADEVMNHGRTAPQRIIRMILEDISATTPDAHTEIVETVADGDTVVARCIVSGTHTGVGKMPVMGGLLMGVSPTGKRYEVQHIHWYRFRDGKIAEHYANRDDIAMMQQLGLLPTAP